MFVFGAGLLFKGRGKMPLSLALFTREATKGEFLLARPIRPDTLRGMVASTSSCMGKARFNSSTRTRTSAGARCVRVVCWEAQTCKRRLCHGQWVVEIIVPCTEV